MKLGYKRKKQYLVFLFLIFFSYIKKGEIMKKIYILIGCVIYFIILYTLFPLLLPFLLSLFCFFMMKPLIDYIEKIFDIKRSLIGIIILFIFYISILCLIIFVIYQISIYIIQILPCIPDIYMTYIKPQIQDYQPFVVFLYEQSSQYLLQGFTFLTAYFQKIPYLIFSIFLFMISTFYLVLEYDDIQEKIQKICSKKTYFLCIQIKNHFLKGVQVYFKCQWILLLVSFLMISIVFSILGYSHSLFLAGMTSLLDCLPFIGIGIVFFPLTLYYIFCQSYVKALYIFLVYLLMNMIRSFLEPRIMNKQMKIPSFFLLISMILHFHFFGFIGMILSPIHLTLLFEVLEHSFQSE